MDISTSIEVSKVSSARTGIKILSFVFLLSTTACGSIADLAEGYLYPVSAANKTAVPETPPAGYEQAFLKGSTTTHLWSFENKANSAAPVVIHFHGNGENIGALHKGGFFKQMETLGTHFVVIDYPGYGKSSGAPEQATLMASAQVALAWTKSRFPQSKVVVWGWSLGAAVAVQTAGLNPSTVRGLIADSPWTSVRELAKEKFGSAAGQIPEDLYQRNEWNSLAMASRLKVPVLVRHGTKDSLIPFKFGQAFAGAVDSGLIDFVALTGKNHGDIFTDANYWTEMTAFIRESTK